MAAETLYFDDVEIGDDVTPVDRVVTSEQVSEFVKIWGEEGGPSRFTDREVAKREGLPGPIVPGAMTIAALSQLLTGWSPSVGLKSLDVTFRQTVPHNAPLRLKGIVTDKSVVDGEARIECDVLLENEEGERLAIGTATVALPIRGSDPLTVY